MSSEKDNMIAGLLHERAGYLRQNKADRAAAVDVELKKLGYEDADDAPQGRSAKPVQTAEGEPVRRGPGRPRKVRDDD